MTTPTDRCPDCNAPVSGGREGCQALFDVLAALVYTDLQRAAVHQLAFDAYCMQHPDTYGLSAKSYAAHLTRLCCGVEFGGDHRIYRAIPRWLSGRSPVAKPDVPEFRGSLTVASVAASTDTGEYVRLVDAWARDVWSAYAHQHDLARQWIAQAMEVRSRGDP
jgi:hypothetical protein